MSTNDNLLLLTPCEAGVPSRRHLVVIRRAEAHVQELVNLLADMNAQVAEAGVGAVTPCQTDLIERAVFELERCTSKGRRAQVATRLTALKKEFKAVRDWFKM
jgi:hypothetical protein